MVEDVQIEFKDGKTPPNASGQEFENFSSSASEADNIQPTMLSFHDLSYKVKVGKPFNKVDKVILRSVTGMFQPGLNAIMGPTGGGKTSLLDLLAKRKDATGLEGYILLNGQPLPKNFRLLAGYVVQDDVVMGTLTVRENLEFAANMRMRNSSYEERMECVDKLIIDLGLEKCQNTKVGTVLIKGVSGGERKRCNIGMELVTKPPILFLDEPTTGLDANTSFTVISLLRNLAIDGNRTVILSIHQPRYSIFRLLDRLLLLSSYGQTIFHGPSSQAVSYFGQHGFVCETYNNPADFFLDVIIENSDPTFANLDNSSSSGGSTEKLNVDVSVKKNLAKLFVGSPENEEIVKKCKVLGGGNAETNSIAMNEQYDDITYAASWFGQFYYQSTRSFKNLVRDPQTTIIPSAIMLVLSTMIGSLYLDWTNDLSGFQNLFGALFFNSIQMMFGNMAALEVFVNGRNLFLHESANGYYCVSSFFLSKVLCDFLPLRAIPTILFSCVFYLMLGLKAEMTLFFFFIFVNIITTMAACALANLISVITGVYATAQALVSVCYIIMVLFAGLVVNVKSMPEFLQPLQYTSIPRYAMALHSSAQVTGLEFCGNKTVVMANGAQQIRFCDTGESLLLLQDIQPDVDHRWINTGVLAAIICFLFTLTYVVLRLMPKKK